MGYFFKKHHMEYVILEQSKTVGSFFGKFPRARKLISFNIDRPNENHSFAMRFDWNSFNQNGEDFPVLFTDYDPDELPSADSLYEYFQDFQSKHSLNIKLGCAVYEIDKRDGLFYIKTMHKETYVCDYLFIATGYSKNKIPDFEGVEHCLTYWESDIRPERFYNKSVAIVGKGNSALEVADYLKGYASTTSIISSSPLREATHTRYVGHVRRSHGTIFDKNMLKVGFSVFNASVEKIEKKDGLLCVTLCYVNDPRIIEKPYDAVILATGFRFDDSIFTDRCKPELVYDGKFIKQTSEYESVNISNLYCLGAQMHALDFGKAAGGFIHGFRWTQEFLLNVILKKQRGKELAAKNFKKGSSAKLFVQLINRLNVSPELFQMNGFIGDFIVKKNGSYEYYENISLAYVASNHLFDIKKSEYLQITLENGADVENPYNPSTRKKSNTNVLVAEESFFIHPVMRHYKNGKQVGEYMLAEDEDNSWGQEFYTKPLSQNLNQSFFFEDPIKLNNYDLVPKTSYYKKAARIVGLKTVEVEEEVC